MHMEPRGVLTAFVPTSIQASDFASAIKVDPGKSDDRIEDVALTREVVLLLHQYQQDVNRSRGTLHGQVSNSKASRS